jgi:hypothetical protein
MDSNRKLKMEDVFTTYLNMALEEIDKRNISHPWWDESTAEKMAELCVTCVGTIELAQDQAKAEFLEDIKHHE